jgi:hypothetical protein
MDEVSTARVTLDSGTPHLAVARPDEVDTIDGVASVEHV